MLLLLWLRWFRHSLQTIRMSPDPDDSRVRLLMLMRGASFACHDIQIFTTVVIGVQLGGERLVIHALPQHVQFVPIVRCQYSHFYCPCYYCRRKRVLLLARISILSKNRAESKQFEPNQKQFEPKRPLGPPPIHKAILSRERERVQGFIIHHLHQQSSGACGTAP